MNLFLKDICLLYNLKRVRDQNSFTKKKESRTELILTNKHFKKLKFKKTPEKTIKERNITFSELFQSNTWD